MRLNIFIALCIGLLTYGLTIYMDSSKPKVMELPIETEAPKAGEQTPAFSFTDIFDKTHSVKDFKGKIVILNFWASWCPPCVKEFPLLLETAAAHKDDVVLIALSSDHDAAAMDKFITKLGKKFDLKSIPNVFIALDENTQVTQGLFQTFRLPETIIIDREQNLREKLVGANWTRAELKEIINSM